MAIYYGSAGATRLERPLSLFFGLALVAYSTWTAPTAGAVSVLCDL